MALPTNTFTTFAAIGNREDLSDDIFRVEQEKTPFFSMCEKIKTSAMNHEWQTQALAAASTSNAKLQGDDAVTTSITPTVRLGNYHQISDKVPRVSGSQQAVDHAGRDDELAYQEVLAGLELKRDMEAILLANQAKTAGAAGTAPLVASVLSWIGTNDSFGGGSGASPTSLDGTAARTDGDQRAFTEALLKGVLQSCWSEGGSPDTIMVGGFNKQQFSTFTGRATPTEDAKGRKIVAAVDVYEGDFGRQKVVANPHMRTRDCLVLQSDMWAIGFTPGRKMVRRPLAVTGDSDRVQLLSEYTLEARNESASGGVFDLTTS